MTIYELSQFKKMARIWKAKSLLFCLRYDPQIVFRRQNPITFIFIKTMSHDLSVQVACLLDILSTSPHYFCGKWIGATNFFILGFKGLMKGFPSLSVNSSCKAIIEFHFNNNSLCPPEDYLWCSFPNPGLSVARCSCNLDFLDAKCTPGCTPPKRGRQTEKTRAGTSQWPWDN